MQQKDEIVCKLGVFPAGGWSAGATLVLLEEDSKGAGRAVSRRFTIHQDIHTIGVTAIISAKGPAGWKGAGSLHLLTHGTEITNYGSRLSLIT